MLKWFKTEFFKWTDKPDCDKCGNSNKDKINSIGRKPPTEEEKNEGHAGVTEVFQCLVCNHEPRFPRYNKLTKLLETRNGRCGEWANCYTGIVRSLGHDTRLVHDLTDHVWTEVYLRQEDRWVHMDPCENAYDTPKLYEKGWGKKLTYCFGVSKKEIVDVTKRYILSKDKNKIQR